MEGGQGIHITVTQLIEEPAGSAVGQSQAREGGESRACELPLRVEGLPMGSM